MNCSSCGCSSSTAATNLTGHILKFSGTGDSEGGVSYLADHAESGANPVSQRVPYVAPTPMRFRRASATFTENPATATIEVRKNGVAIASMATLQADPVLTEYFVSFDTTWAKGDILEILVNTSVAQGTPLLTVVLMA
jgi:hypothetical protein